MLGVDLVSKTIGLRYVANNVLWRAGAGGTTWGKLCRPVARSVPNYNSSGSGEPIVVCVRVCLYVVTGNPTLCSAAFFQ